jgi:hypothetical protein
MSTALAIASVTAVLKDLLNNGLIDHNVSASVGDVTVSALPPDRVLTDPANEKSQLNLFLYQVTQNAGWRNRSLPSRNDRGNRVTNPPLAVDLHYLLTAYGEKELHAEILLGYGMQLLHETPVLTRDAIRRSLAPPSALDAGGLPASLQNLYAAGLAEQVEQIKIFPMTVSTEEISRLWTALQARYRPTAAYQATVVLIESPTAAGGGGLPVRERNIYAVPFEQIVIDQVRSQADGDAPISADQPILAGYTLFLTGRGLRGDDTRVSVGGIEVTEPAATITARSVRCPLPAGLLAGLQGVQVVHYTAMGTPATPHRGLASNLLAFVLRPTVEVLSANTQPSDDHPELRSGALDVRVTPAVGREQRVVLLLNELDAPADRPPLAYGFEAASPYQVFLPPQVPPEAALDVTVDIRDVQPATYVVRVQVDGAESPVATDAATHNYNAPVVTIV